MVEESQEDKLIWSRRDEQIKSTKSVKSIENKFTQVKNGPSLMIADVS